MCAIKPLVEANGGKVEVSNIVGEKGRLLRTTGAKLVLLPKVPEEYQEGLVIIHVVRGSERTYHMKEVVFFGRGRQF